MRGVLSRRETLERALREAAGQQAGLELRTGHVDRLVIEGGRVHGAVVDGTTVDADLVVDASGRAGRIGSRAHGERVEDQLGGDCGLAYVDRTYRLREGAAPGPMNTPLGFIGEFRGYQCLLFLHERGHFSVVLVRPTADPELKLLHSQAAFEAACAAIPVLAEWTDPARAVPTSDVLVGGALRNVYRSQTLVPGLVTVGDAVATTTPTRGRGVAMACMQIEALLRLLDEGADPTTVAVAFDAWCEENIKPWVADHIAIDGGMERRWQGEDIDLGAPADLRPDRGRRTGRATHRAVRRGLLHDDRTSRHVAAGRAARPRCLRARLATATCGRAEPRRARRDHSATARSGGAVTAMSATEQATKQAIDRSTVARVTLLAVVLGATGVAAAVGGLLWPEAAGGGETYSYADIAPDRQLWWGLLGGLAVMGVINVPLQAIATMMLVRARGSVWATVGGSMMWVGIAMQATGVAGWASAYFYATDPGLERSIGSAVIEAANNDQAHLFAFLVPGALLVVLGTVLQCVGLFRAHVVPVWVPIALLFTVLTFIVPGNGALGLVTSIPMAAGAIGLGYYLWRGVAKPPAEVAG